MNEEVKKMMVLKHDFCCFIVLLFYCFMNIEHMSKLKGFSVIKKG